jgi:hypothetical protein
MKTNLSWMFKNKVSFSEYTLTTIAICSNSSKSHTRKIDSLSRKKLTISWILIELTIFAFWSSSSINASLFVVSATTRTNRRMLESIFEKHLNREVWVLRNTITCSLRRRIDSKWRTHHWSMRWNSTSATSLSQLLWCIESQKSISARLLSTNTLLCD